MSMWDLTSDDGQTTAHEHAETPDEKAMRWPQAYSTMLGAHGKESGYATKENGGIDSVMDQDIDQVLLHEIFFLFVSVHSAAVKY